MVDTLKPKGDKGTVSKKVAIVEYYWKYSLNKRFVSYAAALRPCKARVLKATLDGKTCEMCKEVPPERKTFIDRRYAILENCDHVFCLNCVRIFRQILFMKKEVTCCKDQKPGIFSCPVCTRESPAVGSSNRPIPEQDQKTQFFDQYKISMRTLPCPWVKSGLGICMYPEICVAHQWEKK